MSRKRTITFLFFGFVVFGFVAMMFPGYSQESEQRLKVTTEYKVASHSSTSDVEKALNDHCAQGWDVVSIGTKPEGGVGSVHSSFFIVLKRQK